MSNSTNSECLFKVIFPATVVPVMAVMYCTVCTVVEVSLALMAVAVVPMTSNVLRVPTIAARKA